MAKIINCMPRISGGPGIDPYNERRVMEASEKMPARLHDKKCPVYRGKAEHCTGLNRGGPPRDFKWRGTIMCVPDDFEIDQKALSFWRQEMVRAEHVRRFTVFEALRRDIWRNEARELYSGNRLAGRALLRFFHVTRLALYRGDVLITSVVRNGVLHLHAERRA